MYNKYKHNNNKNSKRTLKLLNIPYRIVGINYPIGYAKFTRAKLAALA